MNDRRHHGVLAFVLVFAFACDVLVIVLIGIGWVHAGSEVVAALVGALVVGSLSLALRFVDYVEAQRGYERHEQERREQNVLGALGFFDGGTQRRNVGIAVVSGYWNKVPELHPVLVPLLANQVVYLLKEARRKDAAHEVQNLDRMEEILRAAACRHWDGSRAFGDLLEAIGWARVQNSRPDHERKRKGLEIEVSLIERWEGEIRVGLQNETARPLPL